MTTPSQDHPSPVILCTNHRFKNTAPVGNPGADSQEHFRMQTLTVERVLDPGDTEGGEGAGRSCQSTPGQGRGSCPEQKPGATVHLEPHTILALRVGGLVWPRAYGTLSKWEERGI